MTRMTKHTFVHQSKCIPAASQSSRRVCFLTSQTWRFWSYAILCAHAMPLRIDSKIELYSNSIVSLESGAFTGLTSLVSLLSHDAHDQAHIRPQKQMFSNSITYIPSGVFSDLTRMVYLEQCNPLRACYADSCQFK